MKWLKYKREALYFLMGLMAGLMVLAYLGCEGVDADSDGISGEFELASIPLLPNGFPIYPKNFYVGGIDNMDEKISFSDFLKRCPKCSD